MVFSLIFKLLPDVKLQIRNVWPGGLFTAILFIIGKYLIGIYITSSDLGSAYGASGSLVIFLFWVYYSSIIVLFGAKFTYEYTLLLDNTLKSEEAAIFVEEKKIANNKVDISHHS